MFNNEFERQLAIAKGFDPSSYTPGHVLAKALELKAAQDAAALSASRDKAFPLSPSMHPNTWVDNAINGDTTGFTKDFLLRQTGYSPEYAVEVGAGVKEHPGGISIDKFYGRNSITPKGTYEPERAITEDVKFQRLLSSNPTTAKTVYRRLVGRELDDDLGNSNYSDLQELQSKLDAKKQAANIETIKIQEALRGLLSGEDTYDAQTGKWWTQGKVETGELDFNGRPKTETTFIPTPDLKADALTKYFSMLSGKELPEGDFRNAGELASRLKPSPSGSLFGVDGVKPVDATDAEFLQALQIRKRQLGKPTLTPSEQLEVADLVERKRLSTKKDSWWDSFKSTGESAFGKLKKGFDTMWLRDIPDGLVIPDPIKFENDETRKMWGYAK